jgi:hypothetical protein
MSPPPPPDFPSRDVPAHRTAITAGIVLGISAALVMAAVAYLGANSDPRTRGSGETTGLSEQKPPPKAPNYQR